MPGEYNNSLVLILGPIGTLKTTLVNKFTMLSPNTVVADKDCVVGRRDDTGQEKLAGRTSMVRETKEPSGSPSVLLSGVLRIFHKDGALKAVPNEKQRTEVDQAAIYKEKKCAYQSMVNVATEHLKIQKTVFLTGNLAPWLKDDFMDAVLNKPGRTYDVCVIEFTCTDVNVQYKRMLERAAPRDRDRLSFDVFDKENEIRRREHADAIAYLINKGYRILTIDTTVIGNEDIFPLLTKMFAFITANMKASRAARMQLQEFTPSPCGVTAAQRPVSGFFMPESTHQPQVDLSPPISALSTPAFRMTKLGAEEKLRLTSFNLGDSATDGTEGTDVSKQNILSIVTNTGAKDRFTPSS